MKEVGTCRDLSSNFQTVTTSKRANFLVHCLQKFIWSKVFKSSLVIGHSHPNCLTIPVLFLFCFFETVLFSFWEGEMLKYQMGLVFQNCTDLNLELRGFAEIY